MLIAHLPSGYLVGAGLRRLWPAAPGVMAAALAGSVLPDADVAYFLLIDGGRRHHHDYLHPLAAALDRVRGRGAAAHPRLRAEMVSGRRRVLRGDHGPHGARHRRLADQMARAVQRRPDRIRPRPGRLQPLADQLCAALDVPARDRDLRGGLRALDQASRAPYPTAARFSSSLRKSAAADAPPERLALHAERLDRVEVRGQRQFRARRPATARRRSGRRSREISGITVWRHSATLACA